MSPLEKTFANLVSSFNKLTDDDLDKSIELGSDISKTVKEQKTKGKRFALAPNGNIIFIGNTDGKA